MSGATMSTRGLPYVSGLDGVRGVAILAVLLYHLEWAAVPGGFFGVTLFFTMSGYLITQLIVREFDVDGGVNLASFWGRRLRRLMPASLLAIVIVAAVSISTTIFDGPRLRGDLFAALGYVANWRFAATGTSYEDLFASEVSPFQHFWSLAIEEQLYFVFPVVLLGLLLTRRRALVIGGLTFLVLASVGAGFLVDSRLQTYYGTHVRAAEVLIGALLALVFPVGREMSRRGAGVLASVSVVLTAAMVGFVVTVHTSDAIVYDGGLVLFSLLSCGLILGVLVPGPIRTITSWRPLVAVGKVSYGAYVFHWPIFVALDERRTGLDDWRLDLLRLSVTAAVTVLSYRLVEEPIRRRRVLVRPKAAPISVIAAAASAVVLVALVPSTAPVTLAGVDAPQGVVDFDTEVIDTIPIGTDVVVDRPQVLVLGSDDRLADRLVELVGSTVDVIDASRGDCFLLVSGVSRGGCPTLEESAAGVPDSDLLVLGVGVNEREHVARLVGEPTARRLLEDPSTFESRFTVPLEYVRRLESVVVDRRVLVVDALGGDELGNRLADLGARRTTIAYVDRADDDALDAELALFLADVERRDERRRIVVIGDSVSYGVAQALNELVRDRFEIVWAGGRNCPLVEAVNVRWWEGMEFDMTSCPNLDDTWAPLWFDFDPDIVLVVVSVPEQSEQQYVSGGDWHLFDSPEFVERHDSVVSEMVELASSSGTRLVFFTSPEIHGGALGGARFAAPERVRGWNESMIGYAERWTEIEMFDWASIVERYENEIGGGPGGLRGDGVHMSAEVLADILAVELVPYLDAVPAVDSPPSASD